jgi:menaquinone-9 beta-reductase
MTYDLIVIGGGPGGCATAITAVRSGARVLVLELGRYPRHRVCGEFVSAESLNLLANLLSPQLQSATQRAPRISQARVFADGLELTLPVDPAAASISRYDLDCALWHSCHDAGVEARAECAVRSVEGDGDFVVRTSGDTFCAKAVVNAAGRWSFLTPPETRGRAAAERWIGIKRHFYEVHPASTVDLYFFDGGYCGVQPVTAVGLNADAQIVNASAMVRADVASDLKEVFQLHPALQARAQGWRPAIEQVSTSPLVFHRPEPVLGRILQVGDAATFVDPFIGDGISMALRSGQLAAESLGNFLGGRASLDQAAANYANLYSKRLAPVFRASSLLRKLLQVPSLIRRPAMSVLQHTPMITRQIVRMTR